jgi:hypothetical protein
MEMRQTSLFGRVIGFGRLLAVALLTTSFSGCSSSNAPTSSCSPGARLACSCAAGGSGYRLCETSSQWGQCDCSATAPATSDAAAVVPDAAENAIDGAPAAALGFDGAFVDVETVGIPIDGPASLVPLYSPCATDGECDSGFCFLYNNGNRRCTKICVTSAECPAPSTGCNAKGVCKDPS